MIWFISDAHFGHNNIALFGDRPISGPIENEYWITECWQNLVSRRTAYDRADRVYCLGDMAFNDNALKIIEQLNGIKILIKGNHDVCSSYERKVYAQIHGMLRYKGFWLTHCPMHEQELRGKPNAHGHVHSNTIKDPRYFNLCADNLYRKFGRPIISLDELKAWRDEYYSPLQG